MDPSVFSEHVHQRVWRYPGLGMQDHYEIRIYKVDLLRTEVSCKYGDLHLCKQGPDLGCKLSESIQGLFP